MPGRVAVTDSVAVLEKHLSTGRDQHRSERFVAVGDGLAGQVDTAAQVGQIVVGDSHESQPIPVVNVWRVRHVTLCVMQPHGVAGPSCQADDRGGSCMRAMTRFLAGTAAMIIGAVAVAVATPAYGIANGEAVPDGRYPFAVKLTMLGIPTPEGGTRDSSCTGGLIAPHWVITAAHCFRDADGNRVARTVARETIVTVGRADLTGEDGVTAGAVEVVQHGSADVALARIDKAITTISPIKLANRAPAEGQKARLAGFGFTSRQATRTPDRMRTGQFEVTSVDSTEMGLSGVAPRANTSPCPRDSGGPYFTEGSGGAVLIGVVSRGPDCPHTGPDIATRVDAIAPWIRSVIKDDVVVAPSGPATRKPSGRSGGSSVQAASSEPASAVTGFSPVLLVAVPAVAVAFVVVLIVSGRRDRRGRGYHRRRR
jgi:V8-like Glu-specific endopeptidase